MKKLTQAVFDLPECPVWADSAVVDIEGDVWAFRCTKDELEANEEMGWHETEGFTKYAIIGKGYDTTNWQQSAIDRGE